MDRVTSTLIDLAEAAYDLDVRDAEWLRRVMVAGLPLLDHGLGVAGGIYTWPFDGGEATLHQFHVAAGPKTCAIRLARVAAEVPQSCTRASICMTLSEAVGERCTLAAESPTRHDDCAKDALGLWAVDSDGRGAFIIAPLFERTTLNSHIRHRWQKVGIHLTTGFRLRRALKKVGEIFSSSGERIHQERKVTHALREAAVLVDRAQRNLGAGDPDAALRLWENLVDGRCSMVDWFDSDGRRFVLATCNPPGIKDPHGLTRRERDVATHAALGESGKLISCRLGISSSRVSTLLHDAMRKLRVHTQPELVEKMRRLGVTLLRS